MNLLLLGANGQVGHALRAALSGLGRVITSSRDSGDRPCDLAKEEALLRALDDTRPDLIFNAAAYTQVDRAEFELDSAAAINTRLPAILGRWACAHGAGVVHYSTDYVFDGTASRPYRETDPAHPLGVYGSTKRDGEIALGESGCNHLILRTSWVYDAQGRNFLNTMLRLGEQRSELSIVDDQTGAPTSAIFIARTTADVCRRWLSVSLADRQALSGIYHLTASGQTTWYGFASAIFQIALRHGRLTSSPQLHAISTKDYPTPARRPAWSVLDNTRIRETFNVTPQHWTEGLAEIANFWKSSARQC
ncbi:MAG TPA: dTDP-4-dehydrorhamnose reductase [Dyella sp.]|uniref:dTDP-4-dehydrorhamnose reductase n=1 Tax=Dyella sp. TaxID=1869338 RepID=UPI002F951823